MDGTTVSTPAGTAPIGNGRKLPQIDAMPDATEPLSYYDPPTIPFAEQRSDLRAAVGRMVGERLDTTPGLWRWTSSADRPVQLYVRSNFLSLFECVQICDQIDSGSFPSPLYEKESYEGVRTSYSCNLNPHDPLIIELDNRIADLLGIDPSWGEPLQGQRYEVGQQFQEHADFFYVDQPYWAQY
jgi:prolyl 4-hydroxylase